MRGFPPVQIFLLCLAFIALAVPLSQLTGNNARGKPVTKAAVKAEKSEDAWVRLRFAHMPSKLSVKLDNRELITSAVTSPMEIKTQLKLVKGGADVFLAATWPEGTPDTAITLELAPDGLESRSETRWSSGGSLDEVLTFDWK